MGSQPGTGHDDGGKHSGAKKIRAWLYVSILSVGYMRSREGAKSGSRHREV